MKKKWIRIAAALMAGIVLCLTFAWKCDFKAKADWGDYNSYDYDVYISDYDWNSAEETPDIDAAVQQLQQDVPEAVE